MKPLSPRAVELLEALQQTPGRLAAFFDRRSRAALLLEVGELGELAAVPRLVSFALYGSGNEPQAAFVALHSLLSKASSREVQALDGVLRQRDLGWYSLKVSALQPEGARTLPPALLAVLSCHPSGHVRERAVRALSGCAGEVGWPFLLLRVNDWVGAVREAAREAVHLQLPGLSFSALIAHLPLLRALRRASRADHGALVDAVLARLQTPGGHAALEAALGSLSNSARREAYRLLARRSPEDARRLVERGLEDPDGGVQRWAAGSVLSLFEGERLQQLLARMERSRVMFVRREAYAAHAWRSTPEQVAAKTRQALLDPHAAIREYARLRLQGMDLAALYREALAIGASPGAVAGLGETGATQDLPRLRPLLHHPRPRVRREAARALARLGGVSVHAELLQAFMDSAPGVSRAAALELERWPEQLSLEWLRGLLIAPAQPLQGRLALHWVPSLSRWDALPLLLHSTHSSEPGIRELAPAALRQWLAGSNRRFVPSTPAQVRAAQQALEETRAQLPPALVGELEFLLRTL